MAQTQSPKIPRPKDAATLIIIDREDSSPKVLMGKRHSRHSFMPDSYVFPGGRLDRADFYVPYLGEFSKADLSKMSQALTKRQQNAKRIPALAIAALRECYEEAGIIVGNQDTLKKEPSIQLKKNPVWRAYLEKGLIPNIENIHFFARAITPPMRPKRFDARFFIMDRKHITMTDKPLTDELGNLHWVDLNAPGNIELPQITQSIFAELNQQIKDDALFRNSTPAPFYVMRNRLQIREMIVPK